MINKGEFPLKKVLFYTSVFLIFMFLVFICNSYFKIWFYPLTKMAISEKILRRTEEYNVLYTKNFNIKFKESDSEWAKTTGEILEENYNYICKQFEYYPQERVTVIIYEDGKTLMDIIGLNKGQPPVGAYTCGIISILSPRAWIDERENMEDIYRENTPAVHEFVHFIIDGKTKGNYPEWLTEGIALYMEKATIGFSWEMGKGQTKGITLEDLNKNFEGIDQKIAYRKSYEVLKDIIDNYGFDKLNALLDNLSQGHNINSSVNTVLKVNIKDIE